MQKKIDELVTRNEFLEEIAKKSDKQSMTNALNRKVNKSDMDLLLEKFADKNEVKNDFNNLRDESVKREEVQNLNMRVNEIRGFNDNLISFKEKINRLDEK